MIFYQNYYERKRNELSEIYFQGAQHMQATWPRLSEKMLN